MPKHASNNAITPQRFWAYQSHLDQLTRDIQTLEYINEHQRPIYLTPLTSSTQAQIAQAYESYQHSD